MDNLSDILAAKGVEFERAGRMDAITEAYVCPLSGSLTKDGTRNNSAFVYKPGVHILIPGKTLPAGTSDVMAEHERIMARAQKWDRLPDGRVQLWVVM